jgi:PHD/YefM family antitoxin component YafN of YafNO toxin-antitoxin module
VSTATLTIVSEDPELRDLGEHEVVLVPLDRYNALLDRLEDLEDLIDMLEALKEPRRPLVEYLAEIGAGDDV